MCAFSTKRMQDRKGFSLICESCQFVGSLCGLHCGKRPNCKPCCINTNWFLSCGSFVALHEKSERERGGHGTAKHTSDKEEEEAEKGKRKGRSRERFNLLVIHNWLLKVIKIQPDSCESVCVTWNFLPFYFVKIIWCHSAIPLILLYTIWNIKISLRNTLNTESGYRSGLETLFSQIFCPISYETQVFQLHRTK